MNVLAIAPHPDDESIGCGGALRNHVLKGDRVCVVFLTSGELGLKQLPPAKAGEIREAEAREAVEILGVAASWFLRGPDWMLQEHIDTVAEKLRSIVCTEKWSFIYLPHPREWHPDHKACVPLLRAAFPELHEPSEAPILRGYEIWTPLPEYQHAENITTAMRVKLRAIRAHRSQMAQLAYDRAILGLNAYRGVIAGPWRYAEVFQHITAETS